MDQVNNPDRTLEYQVVPYGEEGWQEIEADNRAVAQRELADGIAWEEWRVKQEAARAMQEYEDETGFYDDDRR